MTKEYTFESGLPLAIEEDGTYRLAQLPLTDPSKIDPRAVYNLKLSFENLLNSFLAEAQAKEIKLSLFIENELPAAYWDLPSLHDYVFRNFLTSSLSYTPAEVTIAIRVENSPGNTISVRISYSGPHAQSALFKHGEKHFEEFDNALLCILAHKGTISVINKIHETTYLIELPLYALCMK